MGTIKSTVLLAIICCLAQLSFGQSKITFEKTSHNFEIIKESDGKVTSKFDFKNTGNSPLILSGVYASCGCTTPEWTKDPINPGKEGTIKVTYDPKNRPGAFTKTIRVTSNASNKTVMLKIQGEVLAREKTIAELFPRKVGMINVKSNYVAFTKIKNNEVKTKEVEFINLSDEPVTIGFKKIPSHIKATVNSSTIEPNEKGKFIITYDGSARNSFGYTSDRIYLTMNNEDNYNFSLSVSATIVEDFDSWTDQQKANAPVVSFDTKEFNFNTIKQGEKPTHTFTLKNTGKTDLVIRKVRASCGCTAVNPEKKIIPAGDSTELKVTFNSKGKRGRQNKSITVITNDPKSSTTVLRLVGTVEVPQSN